MPCVERDPKTLAQLARACRKIAELEEALEGAEFFTAGPRRASRNFVLEGTMQPDGNRDGNDGSHQRSEATVNNQLLSDV